MTDGSKLETPSTSSLYLGNTRVGARVHAPARPEARLFRVLIGESLTTPEIQRLFIEVSGGVVKAVAGEPATGAGASPSRLLLSVLLAREHDAAHLDPIHTRKKYIE